MTNRVTKLLTVCVLMGAGTAFAEAPKALASGAPACGNVMSKGESACERQARLAQEAREHEDPRIAQREAVRWAAVQRKQAREVAATERANAWHHRVDAIVALTVPVVARPES